MGAGDDSGAADDQVENFSSPTRTAQQDVTAALGSVAARELGSNEEEQQQQQQQANDHAGPVSLKDGEGNGATTTSDAAHADKQGFGPDEDSARMYGYEDTELSAGEGDSSSSHIKKQRMNRRNVVTAEAARFEISYHPGRVHLYAPPRQRQKWGETQVLPRINWGDLFFDLHYVAATYNVSNILVYDATWIGLLYAAGTFFPILNIWVEQTAFSSRYVEENDVFHGISRILLLLALATTVLNIRPVDMMSQPSTEICMFVFCLCLCLERCLMLFRHVELYFCGVGQTKVIQSDARTWIGRVLFLLAFYVAAMIVAATQFFPRKSEYESHRLLAGGDAADEHKDEYHGYAESNHTPIILCLVGIAAHSLNMIISVIFCFPSGGRHKQFVVPMNVGFMIHRNGEWISLMLGESIFSLLIVDVPNEGRAFFVTFFFGILTVMLLHYLHFQSQPHDPEDHAMRRDKNAGVLWSYVMNIYSFALVCLGAAYTFFLTDFEDDDIGEGRRLAGGGGAGSEMDDAIRREGAANLFSFTLAIIFLCLDIMTMLHLGIKEAKDRLVSSHGQKQVSYKGLLFVFLRPCLVVFTATLSLWDTNPKELSMIGFACVVAQLSLRKIGSKYMTHQQCHLLDPAYMSARQTCTILECTKTAGSRLQSDQSSGHQQLSPLKEEDSSDSA